MVATFATHTAPVFDALDAIDARGPHVIAQLLAGWPAERVWATGLTPFWAQLARELLDAPESVDRHGVFDRFLLGHADAAVVRQLVFAADPYEPGEPSVEEPEAPDDEAGLPPGCTPLPAAARPVVSDSVAGGTWLDQYIDYASLRSPLTPRLFHESAGLWLLSLVVARRLLVRMPFGSVYPNIWVMWVAETTIFQKSTAMDIANELAQRLFPHLLLPGKATPEALFTDLSGREPAFAHEMTDEERAQWHRERNFAAQRGLLLDEASSLLNEAGRDYNAGLLESFLKLYDCTERMVRLTQKQGRLTARNTYFPFLAASTPAALGAHLRQDKLWTDGWWARCVPLTPEGCWPDYVDTPDEVPEPPGLSDVLSRLGRRLPSPMWPEPVSPIEVAWGDSTRAAWKRYDRAVRFELLRDIDDRLRGPYGRLPTQVLKVATLLAAQDWPGSIPHPVIELDHLARAIDIAERWRASFHRTLNEAMKTSADTLRSRVLDRLDSAESDSLTCRELARLLNRRAHEVQGILDQLVREGEVSQDSQPSGTRGGRPTVRYRRE